LINFIRVLFQVLDIKESIVGVKAHFLIQALSYRSTVGSSPIRHDVSLEAKSFSQIGVESLIILTAPKGVNEVITTHERANLCFDGGLEGRIIHFKLSSLI